MEHQARFCLNLHAAYGCRHSGACCTAGWTIPIEPPAFERVRVHLGDAKAALRFRTDGALPDGAAAIVGVRADGPCVFFESERGRLCAIHRALGPDALPSACRQFPRVVVHDASGMRISLSHFCPSAAALLQSRSRPETVVAPPNVDLGGALDGLDAHDALPPLLHPAMLMDLEGYAAWESQALRVLGRDDLTASQALATIAAATHAVEAWTPGATTLSDAVARAFDREPVLDDEEDDPAADLRRVEIARSSVPADLRPEDWDQRPGANELIPLVSDRRPLASVDHVVRNYLAARLFGNWIAYHGRGLGAIVEYLRTCLAVLKMEAALTRHSAVGAEAVRHSDCSSGSSPWQSVIEPAVRSTDLLLVHLCDGKELARRLSPTLR